MFIVSSKNLKSRALSRDSSGNRVMPRIRARIELNYFRTNNGQWCQRARIFCLELNDSLSLL